MNSKKKNWSLKELQINAYRTLNKRKILTNVNTMIEEINIDDFQDSSQFLAINQSAAD